MEPTKHTRFAPTLGQTVRIAGEDPTGVYTVTAFKDKGKRTTLAVLESPGMGFREIAVSNLLPPIKRQPKVVPTLTELAIVAEDMAKAYPTKRNCEAAACAVLRAMRYRTFPTWKRVLLGWLGVDCLIPESPELLNRAIYHATKVTE